ncbi:MAG: DNA primase [Pseudomonadota bacterium]
MALPDGFLDELRGRVSLARIAERQLSWDRAKTRSNRGEYWACCPFHQEKSASFKIDDKTGRYYCFGCHVKGDAISYVMHTGNMGFMEAVETLAAEAGLAMPARDPKATARAEARAGLSELVEDAVRFYRMQLRSAQASAARGYLDGRTLDDAALERFEIGYAPGGGKALVEAFTRRGTALAELERAGLITIPDDGRAPYDRFRDRIMFPIRDGRNRAIGFGGRAMDPNAAAKYYNSPDTPLFDKGRSLYNHQPAREAAGRAGALIVAEGYMDVIALVRAGFAHAVAPLGTAVTPEQLALMWRMTDEPVIALDGDAAGLAAAARLIDRALPLLEPGKSLRFALLPRGQDPDDVIRSQGAEAMQSLLDAARPLIDLLWERETTRQPLDTPERRAAFDQTLRRLIGEIAHPGVRAHYTAELRARRQALFGSAPRQTTASPRRGGLRPAPGAPSMATRATPLARAEISETTLARPSEEAILRCCLAAPALAAELDDALDRAVFLNIDLDALRRALLAALPDCVGSDDPAAALDDVLTRSLGRAPASFLADQPKAAVTRTRRGGDPGDRTGDELRDRLSRLLAERGLSAEAQEAGERLAEDPSASWRLRDAALAREKAAESEAQTAKSATVDRESIGAYFNDLQMRQIWVKKKR